MNKPNILGVPRGTIARLNNLDFAKMIRFQSLAWLIAACLCIALASSCSTLPTQASAAATKVQTAQESEAIQIPSIPQLKESLPEAADEPSFSFIEVLEFKKAFAHPLSSPNVLASYSLPEPAMIASGPGLKPSAAASVAGGAALPLATKGKAVASGSPAASSGAASSPATPAIKGPPPSQTPIVLPQKTDASLPIAKTLSIAPGEGFTVKLNGRNWIYLGDKDLKEGITYKGQNIGSTDVSYDLAAADAAEGSFVLMFQRQDPVQGKTVEEYIAVDVNSANTPGAASVSSQSGDALQQPAASSTQSKSSTPAATPVAAAAAPAAAGVAAPAATKAVSTGSTGPVSATTNKASAPAAQKPATSPAQSANTGSTAAAKNTAAANAPPAAAATTKATSGTPASQSTTSVASQTTPSSNASAAAPRAVVTNAGTAAASGGTGAAAATSTTPETAAAPVVAGSASSQPAGNPLASSTQSPAYDLSTSSGILKAAQDSLAKKDARAALSYLATYSTSYSAASDEYLFLYASALELPGPQRDIQKAYSQYQLLRDSFPRSSHYDEATARQNYIKRNYMDIR